MSKEPASMFIVRRPGQDNGADGLLTRRLKRIESGAIGGDSHLTSIMDMIAKNNLPKFSVKKLGLVKKSENSNELDSPLFKTPKISSTRPPSRQRTVERERTPIVSHFTLLPTLKDEDWLEQTLPQTKENDPRKTKWIEENGKKYQTPMTTRSHFRTASDQLESKADLTTSHRTLVLCSDVAQSFFDSHYEVQE